MADQRHNPDDRFRRDPRDWGRFKWGYIAHAAQGFFTCAGLGFAALPVLAWYYVVYQRTEYRRFRDVRDLYLQLEGTERNVKDWVVGDWISRDVGDWLYGGYAGAAAGIGWQLYVAVQLA